MGQAEVVCNKDPALRAVSHLGEAVAGVLFWLPGRVVRRLRRSRLAIVITGWYGSETVGDVAILGQILNELEIAFPNGEVAVASFEKARTQRSLRELGRTDTMVVPVGPASAWRQARAHLLVFGGGPFMESRGMVFWAVRAALARLSGAQVVLYGCGIGPIRTGLVARSITIIAQQAALAIVRDSSSGAWLAERVPRVTVVESFDPAYDYVRSTPVGNKSLSRTGRLALVLRQPSKPYRGSATDLLSNLAGTIAAALDLLAEQVDRVVFVGIVMNTGDSSDDDHDFYESVRSRLQHKDRLVIRSGHHSLGDVLEELHSCHAALTIRFHGMIFSLALGKPFVAIDYSVPTGKVSAAAIDRGFLNRVIPIRDIDSADLAARLGRLLTDPEFDADEAPDRASERVEALRALRITPPSGS